MKVKYSTMIIKDTEETLKFYTEVLGFKLDSQYKPRPGTTMSLLIGDGGAMVEAIEDKNYPIGLYSIGVDVKDLKATLNELRAKDAKVTTEPIPTLVGSCAFIEDPNGVRLCLIEYR
jgi:lactoylglutathione lyase